jgi:hypothetical protein
MTLAIIEVCRRYSVVRPPDGKWGGQDENGTWDGMIGMIVRQVSILYSTVFNGKAAAFDP